MSQPVSIVPCPDYAAALEPAVRRAIDLLGGASRFVRPGQSVVIKPNLLTAAPPEAAKTTHPEVVRALIRILKPTGARLAVADSPCLVARTEEVWERTGFHAMCAEEGVPLLNIEKAGSRVIESEGFRFTIAQPFLDADVLINVPKVKTHVLTVLTAGVKNLYGTIPGFQKTALHKQYPKPAEFGRLLSAVYRRLRPALTIADGIVGMDGEGPSGGNPAPLGFLAASPDAAALDVALCRILRIPPRAVPYLAGAEEPEMLGTPLNEVAPDRFRVPSTLKFKLIPRWLVDAMGPYVWTRPTIGDRCVNCGRCVASCPVQALSASKPRPVLTPAACIGCCCCHEVCPHQAIAMTPSPLLRLIRRVRGG